MIKIVKSLKPKNQQVLEENLGLVIFFARKFSGLLPYEDLVQEGRIGLLRAEKTYDSGRGSKFSSWAGICIRHSMLRAIAEEISQSSGVDSSLRRTNRLVDEMSDVLKDKLGREPDVQELAEALSLETVIIQMAQKVEIGIVSINNPISQDGAGTLEDLLPSERSPDSVEQTHLRESLKKAFKHLNKQEMLVLGLRYGLNGNTSRGYKEIARKLHLKVSKIKSIEIHAFSKLRTKGNLQDCL